MRSWDAVCRSGKAGLVPVSKSTPLAKRKATSAQNNFDFSPLHEETLKTIFHLLSNGRNKLLKRNELETAITALGIPPANYIIDEIMRHRAAWMGDSVDFPTVKRVLVSTLRKNPIRLADMHELFSLFGEGNTINESDLRHVMGVQTSTGQNLTDAEIDEVFKSLHILPHQQVDYRTFLENVSSGFFNFTD